MFPRWHRLAHIACHDNWQMANRREEEVIVLIVLMIVGISFLVARIIAYCWRGGLNDHWLNLIERFEQAQPRIESDDGTASE